MKPSRILIVDDSAVIRKVLSNMLASDPEIVVAGTAGNGHQALARIPEARPDLITLDIEMPGMDGLETLVEIATLSKVAGDYVLYADRAWSDRDPGCAGAGCQRLCHQARP